MSYSTLFVTIMAVFILASAFFLITCAKYEDGVIGRIGLILLCFAQIMILMSAYDGTPYMHSPTEILGNIGIGIFMVWHVARFLRRIVRERQRNRRANDRSAAT